ncbi:MAG: glycosyltransferase, partial [Kineosporiaceae bacterium]
MTSIVIAAHDEAAVVGRTLDALLTGAVPGEFDVTVVANGCTDDTAAVAAARPGVRVLDRPEPGKVGALNAGDAVASGFPRLYLDADIALTAADVRTLAAAVRPAGAALAAS